jgi:hypothetical protein
MHREYAAGSAGLVGVLRGAFGPEYKEGADGTLFEDASMVKIRFPVRQDIVERDAVWARFRADADAMLKASRRDGGFVDEELRCEYQAAAGGIGVSLVLTASREPSERFGEKEKSAAVRLAVELKRMMDIGYR